MIEPVQAALGVALVLFPGLALAALIQPSGGWLHRAALAPPLSFFLLYLYGQAADLLDIPFIVWPYLALGLIAGAAAVVRIIRARRASAASASRPPRSEWAALAMLAVGIGLGLMTWTKILAGPPLVPPNIDASHHGFVTARVVQDQTTSPDVLLATDYGTRPTAYYPPALHASAAFVTVAAGVSIADSLLAITVAMAAVFFPAGMFKLTRALTPDHPEIAGFTALLIPCLALFPYKPMLWGGMALITGTAIVPVVVASAMDSLFHAKIDIGRIATTAMSIAGIMAVHTNELALVALLGSAVLGVEVLKHVRGPVAWFKATAVNALVIALLALLLIAPAVAGILGATGEAAAIDDHAQVGPQYALGNLLTLNVAVPHRQLRLALLALAGIVIAIRRRMLGSWLVAAAAIVWLYMLAATKGRFYSVATLAWFRQDERIAYNVALFVPVFGAVALYALIDPIKRLSLRTAVSAATVIALLVVIGMPASNDIAAWQRRDFDKLAPVGATEAAAFRFLSSRTQDEERVLNDFNADGSIWMFPLAGATPVFTIPPPPPGHFRPGSERIELLNRITAVDTDPIARALVEKLCVRFVYLDTTGIEGVPRHLHLKRLRSSPALTEVFSRGPVHVFEIAYRPAC